jgi:hypothetical protein
VRKRKSLTDAFSSENGKSVRVILLNSGFSVVDKKENLVKVVLVEFHYVDLARQLLRLMGELGGEYRMIENFKVRLDLGRKVLGIRER